jgi:outer membrane protein TolC
MVGRRASSEAWRCCAFAGLAALFLLAGCTTGHYRKSADDEAYRIIQQKQKAVFGGTNDFSIATPYSNRKPEEIRSQDIIRERSVPNERRIGLSDALDLAVTNNRAYQFRKETLYLTALNLTRDRHDFGPQFFAGATVDGERDSSGERSAGISSQAGVSQLLKTGARLGVTVANDVLRYYTGDPRPTATTRLSVNLFQPLLRGAGASIVAEGLTQSERNVIYEVRAFSHYQRTFALDVVSAFFRLLQQKDTVRNEYNNYLNLVRARERAEALSRDRLPAFQVDQARQDELRARSRYISTTERYVATVDTLKSLLGLPISESLTLDDTDLENLKTLGLPPVPLTDEKAFACAIEHRLDLLNEIDRFEDSKRKVKVAADQLKPDFNIFANASLRSEGPEDYTRFDLNRYQAGAGVELNLPLDRLRERNTFRASLVSFERQVRSFAQTLDDTRNELRQDLRALDQARQNYDIQKLAVELADRRVESVELLLLAGRAQIRDQLEAASAQVQARNSLTQAVVDYHLARLNLLIDLGVLNTDRSRFWMAEQPIPGTTDNPDAKPSPPNDDVIPPEKLFGN